MRKHFFDKKTRQIVRQDRESPKIKIDEKLKITWEFKLEDMWIGVFWRKQVTHPMIDEMDTNHQFDLWICIIPCFPIHIQKKYQIKYND